MSGHTVNELLCFATNFFDKLDREVLYATLLDFYQRDQIKEAKQILLTVCDKNLLASEIPSESRTNRIGLNSEQRSLNDILDIWGIVDSQKGGNLDTIFVAADPTRLPGVVNANDCNLKFLFASISKLQQQSDLQQATLSIVTKSLTSIHNKIQTPLGVSPINDLNRSLRSLPATPAAGEKRKRNDSLASPSLPSKARKALNIGGTTSVVPISTLVSSASQPEVLFPTSVLGSSVAASTAPHLTVSSLTAPVLTASILTAPVFTAPVSTATVLTAPVLTAPVLTAPVSTSIASSATSTISTTAPSSRVLLVGQDGSVAPITPVTDAELVQTAPTPHPVSAEAATAALAAAAAVGEAALVHTNPIVSSAVKSARKAAKAAKAAAKAAVASKAITSVKESTAATKKLEAEAAAAAAKALKSAASNSTSNESFLAKAKNLQLSSTALVAPSSSSSSSSSTETSSESESSSSSEISSSSSSHSWLLQARKKKKTETIVGCKEGGDLEGVAPRVKDFWDLFLCNLSDKATDFQIKSHLQGHAVEVKDVWMLNSKKKGTKSAKVRIAIEHKNKAKEANVWSKHIHVKDWIRKPKLNV